MVYFQPHDQVVFKGRRATFKGYWPDRQLAMLKFENGGTTSVPTKDIKPFVRTCVEAVEKAFEEFDERPKRCAGNCGLAINENWLSEFCPACDRERRADR